MVFIWTVIYIFYKQLTRGGNMKYLYTVVDRHRNGNKSIYSVKDLKTGDIVYEPIDWIRKQYPKGVFSNISISADGRISIVKDKYTFLDKLTAKVKIIEFLDDAKLDGMQYMSKGEYALKEIEILKPNTLLKLVVSNCLTIDEDTIDFIRNTPKGKLIEDEEVVGLCVDWRDSHGYGEIREKIFYPENMNEDITIRFEVKIDTLKEILKRKQISLTSKEFKRLESAIIYSLLYYCHEWVCGKAMRVMEDDFSETISYFKFDSKVANGEYRSGIGLKDSDVKVIKRYSRFNEELPDFFGYIDRYLNAYDDKKTEDAIIFYNDRVIKEDNKLKYEIYAHSGYFYFDYESELRDDYDDYDDPRDYEYYRDMQYDY